ncbi:hypothetical protein [Kribbella turkmenica]|uniref:hypothetical protein n=1 Tax=Kribbella turkmenica TaxID=2530375 RepID=UPI001F1C07EC|nr:hypothetical protein [Kribbella turkmenica]
MSPDRAAGEFVTDPFEYDGGRQVTVYVPPAPPEVAVFAGDGHLPTRSRALVSSPARRSRGSSRTRPGGRTRCATPLRTSC